jgi:cytochrome c oxidase assembly factor CtaG
VVLAGGAPWARSRGPAITRPLLFVAGVLVLLLALVSPLDTLGDTYLFSAHMAQHLLLVEVVPPLLLLGIPPAMFARLLAWGPAATVERLLGRPTLAWFVGVGTVWVWHAPDLYNAALASENVHIVEHLCFLVAATMFWWPVVAPLPERRRLPSWAACGYLAVGALANSVLGIALAFSPPDIYPAYLHPHDALGILPLIRDGWGLTPVGDQRLGGGLMWMLGSLVYLLAIVLTIARWFGEEDGAFEAELALEEGAR